MQLTDDIFTSPIRTVSEINSEIGDMLENRFRFVRVSGEISNLRRPISGHSYFILKDAKSQLNGVLFKNQQRWLAAELKDGQQVICDGRITVYEPRGQYQLIVDTVDFDGTGRLRLEFERLKRQLRAEGLFDARHKKPIPEFIEKIVLITSPTGAAVHDFISICRKRQADLLVQILPVRVQGDGAAREICDAIDQAQSLDPDVIVLCRGGGSIEDLWAFNDEDLARAIFAADIPVVTGVGHEIDFTIADFCADVRAATPTAAAEMLAVDHRQYRTTILSLIARLRRGLAYNLADHSHRLARATRVLSTFDHAFSHHTFMVDSLLSRLLSCLSLNLEKKNSHFADLGSRLLGFSPDRKIELHQYKIRHLADNLSRLTRHQLETRRNIFLRTAAVLDTLSPLATMARGYSVVSKKSQVPRTPGPIVTAIDQVDEKEQIEIRLLRGVLDCEVVSKKNL